MLAQFGAETHLVITKAGRATLAQETLPRQGLAGRPAVAGRPARQAP
jgi:hypothetical protein